LLSLAERNWRKSNPRQCAVCNGTGVSRGAAFGKAVAELALGLTSPVMEILKRRAAPTKAYPKFITCTGVRVVTRWRFMRAGKEV
jgi:hypothetical protein